MTKVLGYKTFAAHGTDIGAATAYSLYAQFNTSARACHLVFLPFYPLPPDELAAQNISLSPIETLEEQRFIEWSATGSGYFVEHSTKATDPIL
jgi:hypothetical protein